MPDLPDLIGDVLELAIVVDPGGAHEGVYPPNSICLGVAEIP
jgi:hypothetical protein